MAEGLAEPYTLERECARYGLPLSFDALMRHLYGNHALILALKDRYAYQLLICLRDEMKQSQGWVPEWVVNEIAAFASTMET